MFKSLFSNLVTKFNNQSPTVKGFLIIILILIIGIICRWDTIISEVERGFGFFSAN